MCVFLALPLMIAVDFGVFIEVYFSVIFYSVIVQENREASTFLLVERKITGDLFSNNFTIHKQI